MKDRIATYARTGLALIAVAVFVSSAAADSFSVRKNDVIPVVFDDEIDLKQARVNDGFQTHVKDGLVLPMGTLVLGHVAHIQPKRGNRAASMDLAFDTVILPDGTKESLRAVPVPLDSKYVDRDSGGHYTAKASVNKDTAVGVGAIGGLVLGALLHKPFEGAFLGTLAGIAVAETSGNDENLVIKKGSEAGALVQRDASFTPESPDGVSRRAVDRAEPVDIRFGDKQLTFDEGVRPYRDGDEVMVPIEKVATQLGLTYDVANTSVFVENDQHSLRLEFESADYRLDGRRATMNHPVSKRNGVLYAPVEVIAKINNWPVSVNGTKIEN